MTKDRAKLPTRRFACDGFSFQTPAAWNPSALDIETDVRRVDMEDDYSRRLELEWATLPKQVPLANVQNRYGKAARKLKETAKETALLEAMPESWVAFQYKMGDGKRLITAYHMAGLRFFFFNLHFNAEDERHFPREILDLIVATFQIHEKIVPWECYDLAFELSQDFRLVGKSMVAGRKAMVLQWRLRRLYVWLFSFADLALKKRRLADWACEFLATVKGLRGVRFVPDEHGGVVVKRKRLHPFGHFDEVCRICFRYKIGVEHWPERNQIFLWVYHYRLNSDLKKLEGLRALPPSSGAGTT
jgi:hypothetical protein